MAFGKVKTTTSDLDTLFCPKLLACHQGTTWLWFLDEKHFLFCPKLFATLPQREKSACGILCPWQRWDGDCACLRLRPGSVNQDKNPGNAYTRLLLSIASEKDKNGARGHDPGPGSSTAWLRDFLNEEGLLSQHNCLTALWSHSTFIFHGILQRGVPRLAMLCVQMYFCCFASLDPATRLACLILFRTPVLCLEETVSHWFPWMIYLLHVSIGLSIADNLLVISGSRLRIRKTCYDLDSHFLNLTENIVLALVLCLISPAETKILSYSLHWVEPGVSWSFLRVTEDEIKNKSIFDWHKSLVNKPASSLLNLFQYWPIEILENHFSAITRHTKSISAWRCAVKTWQSRKWEHREKKWLNMPRNKVKS